MSDSFATPAQVKQFGALPASDCDAVEEKEPGVTAALIAQWSEEFKAKLIKRYPNAFVAPYPLALVGNICRVVAYRLWLKRGGYPPGELFEVLKADHDKALAWLDEAANSETGLIELTARDPNHGTSAVAAAGPLAYTESSPYVFTDIQGDAGRREDQARRGSP